MNQPKPLTSKHTHRLGGTVRIPGDKSISHRAIMLGSLAVGETIISGLLEGEDVMRTAEAMRKMGANIERGDDGLWRVFGVGTGGLQEPEGVLDMGNSGTSARLLMGIISSNNITATMSGDASLTRRPMKRVMTPLAQMGAKFAAREGGFMPLTITGAADALSIEYRLPVASAQVKSAILLAGLNARGRTTVIEETPTRDHSENMLRHMGVEVEAETLEDGAQAISVTGYADLQPCAIDVPGDPSSAAFPVVAALLRPGSEIALYNICVNERRTGLYKVLRAMGADIAFNHQRVEAGESVADLTVRGGDALKGIDVPEDLVPSMIDEFPVLAMAASCAEGTTRMRGLAELRVKESDRLLMVAEGLKACGVSLEMGEDWLTIHGTGKPPQGGTEIKTSLDHRIAMSFLVLGAAAKDPIRVDDASPIATSFPDFVKLMNELGTEIE